MRDEREIVRAQELLDSVLHDLGRDLDADTRLILTAHFDALSWVLGFGAMVQRVVERLDTIAKAKGG